MSDGRTGAAGTGARRAVVLVARVITYVVYLYVLLVEVVLLIGFLLLLGGANPSSGFVEWSYRNLESAMEPFRGMFASIELGMTGNEVPSVFESSILFAMVVYAIVAVALNALIDWLSSRLNTMDYEARMSRRQQDELVRKALQDRNYALEAELREVQAQQLAATRIDTGPMVPPTPPSATADDAGGPAEAGT